MGECEVLCLGNHVHRHHWKQKLRPILQKTPLGLVGTQSRAQVKGDNPLPKKEAEVGFDALKNYSR